MRHEHRLGGIFRELSPDRVRLRGDHREPLAAHEVCSFEAFQERPDVLDRRVPAERIVLQLADFVERAVTVNLPAAIDPQQVTSVHIRLPSPPLLSAVLVLDELKLTFGQSGTLYSTQTTFQIVQDWFTAVKAEVPPPPAGAENECVRKSCCIKKLIAHLNCNLRYYNRAVWMAEDPNDRVMEWSCCMRDGSPYSLISEIVNEPITVYGDFVVFPVVNSQLVDDPTVLPVSELISMPTPGVYSEGLLGQCDTCEKVDPDSNWNWKDSPCPECPELPSPPDPQAGVKPSELKADAITNLITLTSVPTAPASVLKDLVSELVKLADAGSGQAQSLLEKLLTSIKEVMTGKKEEKK